jgi:hypothetical protein
MGTPMIALPADCVRVHYAKEGLSAVLSNLNAIGLRPLRCPFGWAIPDSLADTGAEISSGRSLFLTVREGVTAVCFRPKTRLLCSWHKTRATASECLAAHCSAQPKAGQTTHTTHTSGISNNGSRCSRQDDACLPPQGTHCTAYASFVSLLRLLSCSGGSASTCNHQPAREGLALLHLERRGQRRVHLCRLHSQQELTLESGRLGPQRGTGRLAYLCLHGVQLFRAASPHGCAHIAAAGVSAWWLVATRERPCSTSRTQHHCRHKDRGPRVLHHGTRNSLAFSPHFALVVSCCPLMRARWGHCLPHVRTFNSSWERCPCKTR